MYSHDLISGFDVGVELLDDMIDDITFVPVEGSSSHCDKWRQRLRVFNAPGYRARGPICKRLHGGVHPY